MVCFFKKLSDFSAYGQADVTDYNVPLGSSGGSTGYVTVVGELTQDYTRQWLLLDGNLFYIVDVAPQNGQTNITVGDALTAFGRTLVYTEPSTTNLGTWIASLVTNEYINLSDTAYDMPYLTVTNAASVEFAHVYPEDGLFSLESVMRDAQSKGVNISFTVGLSSLTMALANASTATTALVVGDGHTQLISETYAKTAIAKVTVISTLGYPHDYYLAWDGTISTTVPLSRADGEWITVKQGEDNLANTAAAAFSQNIESHKIELYSDVSLGLFSNVAVRLADKLYTSKITYVGVSKKDNRFLYRCGDLATTLTEKVASITASLQNSIPVKVSELQNDAGFITAAQAPVQSVNGQTGAVVLDASDVGALPANQSLSIESSTSSTAVSVASATWTTVKSITLYPGRYLIVAGANFASNSTGHRRICISTGGDNNGAGYYCYDIRRAVDGFGTNSAVSRVVYVTSESGTTYNLNVYQNSGAALTVNWGIEIQRID